MTDQDHSTDQGHSNDDKPLRPATAGEIAEALSHALRYEGKKRAHSADEIMAKITADRLVRQLEQSGFVVMRKPQAPARFTPKTRVP